MAHFSSRDWERWFKSLPSKQREGGNSPKTPVKKGGICTNSVSGHGLSIIRSLSTLFGNSRFSSWAVVVSYGPISFISPRVNGLWGEHKANSCWNMGQLRWQIRSHNSSNHHNRPTREISSCPKAGLETELLKIRDQRTNYWKYLLRDPELRWTWQFWPILSTCHTQPSRKRILFFAC